MFEEWYDLDELAKKKETQKHLWQVLENKVMKRIQVETVCKRFVILTEFEYLLELTISQTNL